MPDLTTILLTALAFLIFAWEAHARGWRIRSRLFLIVALGWLIGGVLVAWRG